MRIIVKKMEPILGIIAALWVVEIVNLALGHGLTSWGILPRSFGGLVGIPLAPFIHASIWHAIANTVPLLVLGALTLSGGTKRFWETTIAITLLAGVLIWLFARGAFHVGASGLVFGYFGALVARGVIERSIMAVLIALVTLVLYSGLLWGLLPLRSYVSFESHLFGLVAGVAVVWLDNRFGKSPTVKS
jgi:membrane associated rhomboid family serine protease